MSSDGCSLRADSPQHGCHARALFLKQGLLGLGVLHRGSRLQQRIDSQRVILADNVRFLSNRSDVRCVGGQEAGLDRLLVTT